MRSKKFIGFVTGLFLFFGMVFSVFSEEIDLGNRKFDENDVINALNNPPKTDTSDDYKPRAFQTVPKEKPKALSVEITFKKNSYRLTADARKKLDVVGKAFNSDQLIRFPFLIEGHTDASGNDNYNMRLSKQRANEVKRYLTQNHNVNPYRLETEGKGENELLLQEDPYNGRNRRVRIVNMGN
ncbi:MAG: OmpA family protein [Desulfococcaceae bacterium]|jgi:outer membrane protein OmpA-like peptidoglycan-associated protein|nr:OmpA family protein [Desulfococcaceae bacterium]